MSTQEITIPTTVTTIDTVFAASASATGKVTFKVPL